MLRLRPLAPLLLILLLALVPALGQAEVKLGIDVLGEDHPELVRGKKLALLVSGPSLDRQLDHVIDRLSRAATIEVIFTGEKYFRTTLPGASGTRRIDALTNAPVHELLNPLKRPTAEQLGQAELILIDVQDVGIRYQQYVTLLAQFLELAREIKLPVILLDRPNPINGTVVSGPVLEVNKRSRYGVYPIPLVYGMTIGELALYFNKAFGVGAALTVVGMEGYSRRTLFRDTGLHWVPPSDHLPEPETPWVYAITGFLGEMGIFSTGVGTTRPFRYVLAPWIDGELLAHKLSQRELPGVRFLPVMIQPYYGLYQNKRTPGIELVIDDPLGYDPVLTGIAILQALWEIAPDRIPLKNPAVAAGLDTLLGSSKIREALLRGQPAREIQAGWQEDLARFMRERQAFLLYPETPLRIDE
ncbi:MAG TPA: DUF1343 domain-containing protein [Candidatus Ozemobacteraceae bacterium]|nr:DUF1343 domain-containing protein [Candidatus Ozemobacteraceae bacterium]